MRDTGRKTGETEKIVLPYQDLLMSSRRELQLRLIGKLTRLANELGLEGKRVTEIIQKPTFARDDLVLSLKWEA